MGSGRTRVYSDEELMMALAAIEVRYGYIGIATMQQAYAEGAIDCPSHKTFERCLGGMTRISTKEFRRELKPYIEKAKKEAENSDKSVSKS